MATLWEECLDKLKAELSPKQFNTCILPLHVVENGERLRLLAPNHFVKHEVEKELVGHISAALYRTKRSHITRIVVEVGSEAPPANSSPDPHGPELHDDALDATATSPTGLHPDLTFEAFVQGRSNEGAFAYAHQVYDDLGGENNPFLIYGGTGLGKTHLMQALGHATLGRRPEANVVYVGSEHFFAHMVSAIKNNTVNDFQRYYRSVDVLLIDDVQFFVGKERTQEEFFHIFNKLHENQRQIVVTCDRLPKEMSDLPERLISRLSWGLSALIEPPDMETRITILIRKAERLGFTLSVEVAHFIAEHIRSNVRELEGALRRVIANARFVNRTITIDLTREALRDILAVHSRHTTIEAIQQTVARYYKIRVVDLKSKRKNQSIARPRQIAMALAKELTHHSLPEIGDAFERDHTTVLHAQKRVRELVRDHATIKEEYKSLRRMLTG